MNISYTVLKRLLMPILLMTLAVIWCILLENPDSAKPFGQIPQKTVSDGLGVTVPRDNDAGIETRTYTVPGCPCNRTGFDINSLLTRRKEAQERPEAFPDWFLKRFSFAGTSTCSDFATQRGGGQRVVSYVYYSKTGRSVKGSMAYKKYLSQLYNTVDVIGRVYPGWMVRIHHNVTIQDTVAMAELCRIYCDHDYVDLCHAHDLPGFGFWGAHNKDLDLMRSLRDVMYSKPQSEKYNHDQKLLKAVVWPVARTSVLNHESFTCKKWRREHGPAVPFPTQRVEGTYCGWGTYKVAEAKLVAKSECPVECRPKDHQDWTRC
ncbi:uncharacterized protein LOC122242092 isoform X2 [Penaeus japonicus]|uniref:uncharacterized protein LOC122242092 isoform X2 n=1 Tax=Penaeus japonicus TaxID=27405 RepID=UPI001C70C4B5|nr:uncharacterized protein LOC122242092 isoform X2 [Penaeus japonicus]